MKLRSIWLVVLVCVPAALALPLPVLGDQGIAAQGTMHERNDAAGSGCGDAVTPATLTLRVASGSPDDRLTLRVDDTISGVHSAEATLVSPATLEVVYTSTCVQYVVVGTSVATIAMWTVQVDRA